MLQHITTYNNEDPKFVEQFLRSLHVDDLNIVVVKISAIVIIFGEINRNSIVTKVLGLIWDKHKDNITFAFQNLVALICPCPTKGQLLSFIASIYDMLLVLLTHLFSV